MTYSSARTDTHPPSTDRDLVVNKRTCLTVFQYLLAFGLLAHVIYSNWAPADGQGLADVWQRHVVERQPVNGGYLLAGSLVFSAALVLTILHWYVLVRAQDLPFRFRDALRLGLVGFFFSAVLPG